MKKHLLISFSILFLGLSTAFAQQKVKDGSVNGGNLPSKDAILELESNNKGFLHTRVSLVRTTDSAPLTAHTAGMMVYNISTINDVVPGIYYNDGTKWIYVRSNNAVLVENQPGKTGAPGTPGSPGGPGLGVSIVTNDSGTWVYNPITNTWTNLNGKNGLDGKDGIDGKSIIGADGNPGTNTISKEGDTYVNTSTGDTYVKQGNTWMKTGNIKGAKGDAGIVGVQGLPGTSGTPGTPGSGLPGAPGTGITVVTNDSGTWVYNPTTNTWTNINGPKGDKGDDGVGGNTTVGTGLTISGTGTKSDPYLIVNTVIDRNTKNVTLAINGTNLSLTDTDGGVVSVPLADIKTAVDTDTNNINSTLAVVGNDLILTDDKGVSVKVSLTAIQAVIDRNTKNVTLAINGTNLSLTDTDGGVVSVPLADIKTAVDTDTNNINSTLAVVGNELVLTDDKNVSVKVSLTAIQAVIDRNTKNVTLAINGTNLSLTDTDGGVVSVPLADIKTAVDTDTNNINSTLAVVGNELVLTDDKNVSVKVSLTAIQAVIDRNTKNVTLAINGTNLSLTDTDGGVVSVPLADIKTAVDTDTNNINSTLAVVGNELVLTDDKNVSVKVSLTAILASQKTASVKAGTNVSVTPIAASPTGDTEYTVNVATANGTNLGVVQQAATNPTVTITNGVLAVNTTSLGKNLTTTNGAINATGGTGATLTDVTLAVKANNGLTVANDNVQLGGALTAATTVTTTGINTLALVGLQAGVSTNNIIVADASGVLKNITPATLLGATTNSISNTTNTITSTVNGKVATAPAVNTVSNTVSGGNVSTTVNGVIGSATAIPNALSSSANTLSSTVASGTAQTASIINANLLGLSGTNLTSTINGIPSNALNLGPAITAATTQTLSSSNNTITSVVNGISVAAPAVNSNILTVTSGSLVSTINGVSSSPAVPVLISASNGLTAASGDVKLGGALTAATTVTTTAANTLALTGLPVGVVTDNIMVSAAGGVLKTIPASSFVPNNIYTADGTLANNRIVSMNGKTLRFQNTSNEFITMNTVNSGLSTLQSFGSSRGTFRAAAGTAGTATFVDMFTDAGAVAQVAASGAGLTGMSVGTANGFAIPLSFMTNGLTRATITPTGEMAIGAISAPSFVVGGTTIQPLLHVAGDISTTGKVWTTNSVYADYVFEKYFKGRSVINPGYEFKSLNYVRDFIKANNHLPGVESIDDLKKANNGYTFDMTKLTIQSLEKIEELYLHTLEQQEKIDKQQIELNDMKTRLERLEKLLLKENK